MRVDLFIKRGHKEFYKDSGLCGKFPLRRLPQFHIDPGEMRALKVTYPVILFPMETVSF